MKKLVIIGAGGFAKSVIDSVDKTKYELVGFVDEFSKATKHCGLPILAKSFEDLPPDKGYVFFIAIGNNLFRKRWYKKLDEQNLEIINVVDPTAVISSGAVLGKGVFVGKMAIINNDAVIGNNCIINTRSLVEHGCNIGDSANISTNTVINGDVKIGEGSFIGSCSVVIGQIRIGCWSTVGAGAVVIRDVGDGVTVAGIPARQIKVGAMLG